MKKLKLLVITILMMSLFFSLMACSDDEGEDKEDKKEVTREDEMKANKNWYMAGKYADEDDKFHYCVIDGKGELVEFVAEFSHVNDFYNGYAIAWNSEAEFLINKDLEIIFEAEDLNRSNFYPDLIEYEDKETGAVGCIRYDGKILVEAKYDDISIYDHDDLNGTYYDEYCSTIIEGNKEDDTTDYYNINGLLLFSGQNSIMYRGDNHASTGFGVVADAEIDDGPYYNYYTGKKIEDDVRFFGPIGRTDDKYILYDKDYNVIKEIPKESEDKKYTGVDYGKKLFWLYYKNESREVVADVYSCTTGELLFTVDNSVIKDIYDKENNQYLVHETETEDDVNVVNIVNEKGETVFTNSEGYEYVSGYSTYNFFLMEKDDTYSLFTIDGFKKISTVGYERIYTDEEHTYIYITEDNTKCIYLSDNGKYKEFDMPFTSDGTVRVERFLLYDYLILEDNTNRYVIDGTTGKVTFELGSENYYDSMYAPIIVRDTEIYDYSGKLIIDSYAYGK